MNTPILMNVPERHTEHGADTPEATKAREPACDRSESDLMSVTAAYDNNDVNETPP